MPTTRVAAAATRNIANSDGVAMSLTSHLPCRGGPRAGETEAHEF
jgi:hypothetical protein